MDNITFYDLAGHVIKTSAMVDEHVITQITEKTVDVCTYKKITLNLHSRKEIIAFRKFGSLAEWLGAGLQNRLQQFDSARNLYSDFAA